MGGVIAKSGSPEMAIQFKFEHAVDADVEYCENTGKWVRGKILANIEPDTSSPPRTRLKLQNGETIIISLPSERLRPKNKNASPSKKSLARSPSSNKATRTGAGGTVSRELYCLDTFVSKSTKQYKRRWRHAQVLSVTACTSEEERSCVSSLRSLTAPSNPQTGEATDFTLLVHYTNWDSKYDIRLSLEQDWERLVPLSMLSTQDAKSGIQLDDSRKEKVKASIRQMVRAIYQEVDEELVSQSSSSPVSSSESSDNDFHSDEEPSLANHTTSVDRSSLSSLNCLKQGCPFEVGDSVDALDYYKANHQLKQQWRPAEVIAVTATSVRVHFEGWPSKWDTDIDISAVRMRIKARRTPDTPGGTRTARKTPRRFLTDGDFRAAMRQNGMKIFEVAADGNCLFRAVCHQCYLDPERHAELRTKTANHMNQHRNRFKVFVTEDFDEYLKRIRKVSVWGDDLEIRAIEEILDRPIQIYSPENSDLEPLKINFDEIKIMRGVTPIKLSYHGHSHYNSVVDSQTQLPLEIRKSTVILKMRKKQLSQAPPASAEAKESDETQEFERKYAGRAK